MPTKAELLETHAYLRAHSEVLEQEITILRERLRILEKVAYRPDTALISAQRLVEAASVVVEAAIKVPKQ